jgi:hypothetical protein
MRWAAIGVGSDEVRIRSGGPAIDRTENKQFSIDRTATFL